MAVIMTGLLREVALRIVRNRYWALLPAAVFAVSGVLTNSNEALAQRGGQVVGAGAAGLAIGLILGSMANQGQASPNPDRSTPERRPYPKAPNRSVSQSAHSPQGKAEIERIQEALNLLGYDAGTVDGAMGPQTLRAIAKFRAAKKLPHNGIVTAAEQRILFADVQSIDRQPAPPLPHIDDKTRGATSAPIIDPRFELAHWETVKSSKSTAELEHYLERYPDGQFAGLARIRLEQIRLDESRPDRPEALAEGAGTPELPAINDSAFPKAKQRRPDAVAVIIGNSTYGNDVPKVDYAMRDAQAMKLLAVKTLGIESKNVIYLENASRAAMDKVFGTDKDHKGHLWRLIDPDGRSDVFVFFSGHGLPSINDAKDNFLLPVDGDPNLPNISGYPLSQLYRNLGLLEAKSMTVFLDACFSGQAPDNKGTPLIRHASPVFATDAAPVETAKAEAMPAVPDKINLFAASAPRQLSSWDATAGHGLFTRWLLQGIAGEADEDKNSAVTAKELMDFVHQKVRRAARVMHGRDQQPRFFGDSDFVVARF